jgi:hypothetical protein
VFAAPAFNAAAPEAKANAESWRAIIADLQAKLSKYVRLSPSNNGDRSTNTPAAIDPNTATIDDLVKDTLGQ